MKKLIFLLFFFTNLNCFAQFQAGKIVYNYTLFWDRIYGSMPFLSQQEKDRIKLTWGNEEGYTQKMDLFFSPTASFYTYGAKNENETYSWQNDEYLITRDFSSGTITEIEYTLGKTYIIKDKLPEYKWRVMNELREIQGYMCMKAITYDSLKAFDVVAWFCPQINVSVGPERYLGLPGAILGMELNTDHVLIEAISITPGDYSGNMVFPKKMKGKELSTSELNIMTQEHIRDSIKALRNPYSAIRY